MIRFRTVALLLAPLAVLSAVPAKADGNVQCKAGPKESWKPIDKLKKQVWLEGWEIIKTQVEGDCYEVYARNGEGQVVEAFFHPVTLKKLVVFRRGQEIFRAKGF